jgi:hypothetical protein
MGRIEMTMRYPHLSVDYERSAVAKPVSFGKMETESQQNSQQAENAKVVSIVAGS